MLVIIIITIIIWHFWSLGSLSQKYILQVGVGIKLKNIWSSLGGICQKPWKVMHYILETSEQNKSVLYVVFFHVYNLSPWEVARDFLHIWK